ncbi:MAG: hypothetical protein K9M45_06890 [Kiritimatiellales bacterium]|nr:hypothetical protein [Kiritimatiellales bacterium]
MFPFKHVKVVRLSPDDLDEWERKKAREKEQPRKRSAAVSRTPDPPIQAEILDDILDLLKSATDEHHRSLIAKAFFLGCRYGECLPVDRRDSQGK